MTFDNVNFIGELNLSRLFSAPSHFPAFWKWSKRFELRRCSTRRLFPASGT